MLPVESDPGVPQYVNASTNTAVEEAATKNNSWKECWVAFMNSKFARVVKGFYFHLFTVQILLALAMLKIYHPLGIPIAFSLFPPFFFGIIVFPYDTNIQFYKKVSLAATGFFIIAGVVIAVSPCADASIQFLQDDLRLNTIHKIIANAKGEDYVPLLKCNQLNSGSSSSIAASWSSSATSDSTVSPTPATSASPSLRLSWSSSSSTSDSTVSPTPATSAKFPPWGKDPSPSPVTKAPRKGKSAELMDKLYMLYFQFYDQQSRNLDEVISKNKKMKEEVMAMRKCIKEAYYLLGIIVPDVEHPWKENGEAKKASILLQYCYLKYGIGREEGGREDF